MIELYENERIDYVNDSLSLIQKPEGLTFGTDALLLAGYINTKGKLGAELGSGSGIISLLLLSRGKLSDVLCIEVQEEYARLTERNAELNGLCEHLTVEATDIRDYKGNGGYEVVFTNPPYMKTDSGRANEASKKNIARHEVCGGIGDFLNSAKRLLKYGGSFFAVYRPDRLTDLMYSMRENKIEPKRLTFVHADPTLPPSMVLVEGKLGGRSGLKLTPPLLIYADGEHKNYTDDMNYIMDTGSFPEKFT